MFQSVFVAIESELSFVFKSVFRKSESFEADFVGEASLPILLHVSEKDLVVRSLWTSQATGNSAQIEFEDFSGELWIWLGTIIDSVETLGSEVFLDGFNFMSVSVGLLEILNGLIINREVTLIIRN